MYHATTYSDDKASVFQTNMSYIEENDGQLYSYNNQNSYNQPESNVDIQFKTEELHCHQMEESNYTSDPFIVDDAIHSQNDFMYQAGNSNDGLNFFPQINETRHIQKSNAFTNYHEN